MDKVSVIIPVYNSSNVIDRCIESIVKQTYYNLEILCINDGSTDDSLIKLKKIEKKDSRIKILDGTNSGVSSARNKGIEHANGKYVMFVDSDDYLKNDMIEKFVNEISNNESEFIIANHLIEKMGKIKENNIKISAQKMNREEFLKSFYVFYKNSVFNQSWNKLYIRDKINFKFDKNITLGEDLLFNILYINNVEKITYINNSLYVYDMSSENSLTKKCKHNEQSFLELYIYIYNYLYYKNNLKSSFKFDLFTLRHYCSFLEKKYDKKFFSKIKKYEDLKNMYSKINFLTFKDKIIKRIIFSKICFYFMNVIFTLKSKFLERKKNEKNRNINIS